MRIHATPNIAGNKAAVEELRTGLASAVAVAVATASRHAPREDRQVSVQHDAVVAQATAETAPQVAELLETAIAERLARRRLYAVVAGREPDELPSSG